MCDFWMANIKSDNDVDRQLIAFSLLLWNWVTTNFTYIIGINFRNVNTFSHETRWNLFHFKRSLVIQTGILFCRYYIYIRDILYVCFACHTDLAIRVRNISDQMHLQVTQRSSIFQRHGNVHTLHMFPRWHISNNASFYDNLRFTSHDVLHYSYNLYFVERQI